MSGTEFYNIEARTIDGDQQAMRVYAGKALLIVNVASRCGFTPQYAGLEALFRKYKDKGLVVLGFPCNQFGAQEPGADSEIAQFCTTRYDVTFPMFSKIDVNGEQAHPLYRWLKHSAPGVLGSEAIKWNFTKFLVDRKGKIIRRFASTDTPQSLESAIETVL